MGLHWTLSTRKNVPIDQEFETCTLRRIGGHRRLGLRIPKKKKKHDMTELDHTGLERRRRVRVAEEKADSG